MAPLDQLEKCRKPNYRHLGGGSRRCDEMSFLLHTSGSNGASCRFTRLRTRRHASCNAIAFTQLSRSPRAGSSWKPGRYLISLANTSCLTSSHSGPAARTRHTEKRKHHVHAHRVEVFPGRELLGRRESPIRQRKINLDIRQPLFFPHVNAPSHDANHARDSAVRTQGRSRAGCRGAQGRAAPSPCLNARLR